LNYKIKGENEVDKKRLWKFKWEFGGQGYIEGLFIATKKEVDAVIGVEVYFGEVLGKHSEIYGTIDEEDIIESDASDATIEELEDMFGEDICGYNPLSYISED
jgi:hypothetical protein